MEKTFKSRSGKEVKINLTIGTRGKISGTVENNAGTFDVSNLATVQGRKVLVIGTGKFQIVPDHIYNEIHNTAKDKFGFTQQEIDGDELREAEAAYNRAWNRDDEARTVITLRNKWNELSAEYHAKYD